MSAVTKGEASLASAMAAAFAEIEGATKSATNPHFKSKYADLTAVIDAIKPALIKHGLFFTQRPQPTENGITVATMLHHTSGEQMELGALFVPANKNDAQGFGSALTYARRYALVTAFGVPVEDDDGNAAAGGYSQRGRRDEPPAANGPNLRGQLEQSIAAEDAPRGRTPREKLDGPHTSWTALERAVKDFDRQVRSCGDRGELDPYLATDDVIELRIQLERDAPEFLFGGPSLPPEFEPLDGLVARLRKDFDDIATANHITDLAGT